MQPMKLNLHLIGVFYYSLGNLEPKSQSLLHTIQLVALVKTQYIHKHGICNILMPFMESILQLEKACENC
jgi:type III secretory pathway component EscS